MSWISYAFSDLFKKKEGDETMFKKNKKLSEQEEKELERAKEETEQQPVVKEPETIPQERPNINDVMQGLVEVYQEQQIIKKNLDSLIALVLRNVDNK